MMSIPSTSDLEDDSGFTLEAFETVKQQFRDIDCLVTDFSDTHFEIVHDDFPAKTLINPTPFYLEYTTILWARPGGLLQRFIKHRDAFLNEANLTGHVTKFTGFSPSIDPESKAWEIQATVRFVSGVVTSSYATESIRNWTNLWFQDLAKVIQLDGPFELIAMMHRR